MTLFKLMSLATIISLSTASAMDRCMAVLPEDLECCYDDPMPLLENGVARKKFNKGKYVKKQEKIKKLKEEWLAKQLKHGQRSH